MENPQIIVLIRITLIIGIFLVLLQIVRLIKRMIEMKHRRELISSVTPLDRGTESERDLVYRLLKSGIPAKTIFHDLLIDRGNGEYSQIDVVVPTKIGILVFEVKDYNGWIFGNGGHEQWTQVMAYGNEKYRFYNPIRQNASHIRYLRKELNISDNIPVFSIIVFYGNSTLKDLNYIPRNTFVIKPHRLSDVITNILNSHSEATFADKWEVVHLLRTAVDRGSSTIAMQQHIQDIGDKLGKHRIYE